MAAASNAFYHQGALRGRSKGPVVLHAQLTIPSPESRVRADWQREVRDHLDLQPGDVEALPLARARLRWNGYRPCVQAVAHWMQSLGLADAMAQGEVALMACRGANYHHDAAQYGDKAFCNLFLSEDRAQDLHFPDLGLRIPLRRGTAVVFDTAQRHGVIARHRPTYDAADFPAEADPTQVFLTWELPLDAALAHALAIHLETA